MTALLILPILIPMLTGIATILVWNKITLQRALSLFGTFNLLVVSLFLFQAVNDNGILVMQMGSWEAPIGISFVGDLLSTIMIVLTAIVGFTVTLFSTVNIDRQRVAFGYYPLTNFLIMGICGAFLTGDMFNLYVWFEVLLIASFVLLGLGGRAAQLQGTVKYVVINLISSTIFLSGLGILYGVAGTLNMAQVAQRLGVLAETRPGVVTTLGIIFLLAFGIKAALFPLYFWLPASYHTAPTSVSSLMAGLLTKVGVYAILRVFTLMFVHDMGYTHVLLIGFAGLTMLSGVLGAIDQMDFRRLLSFHIVSQIGYMIMGIGIFGAALSSGRDDALAVGTLALAGTVFYIMHHIIVKANLFLIAGLMGWLRGSFDLKKLGGLIETRPALSILFFLTGMSLAGLPPLSGFWPKFVLVRAGLLNQNFFIVIVSLFTSLLTMYSMTKVWRYAYWQSAPERIPRPIDYSKMELLGHLVPIMMLVGVMLYISFSADSFFQLAEATATQLIERTPYITAVMGDN